MGLEAQTPPWMLETVANREGRVLFAVWTVHGLEEEVTECEVFKPLGLSTRLRKDELELVALA